MKRTCWPVAVLAVLLADPDLHGQFLAGPPGLGVGVGFTRVNRHSVFSFGLARGYGAFYGNPYYSPFGGASFTEIRVCAPPPPPIIVQQAPPVVNIINPPPMQLPSYDEVMARREAMERPLPGRDAGIFRPLDADNRARARQPFRPDQPPPRQAKEPPPKERPGPPARGLPRPPLPEADPRAESARQVGLGKDAFAQQEYGRAAERFRLAVDAAANEALPHFLLAQAQLALGNYRRAFDAIQIGLNLKPDWPATPFRPLDLYGDNVADYAAHLNALQDVLAANPNDAVLLFLSAYELWFDGRKAEARALFERAAPALPDRGVVDRFLQALPGVPVV